MKPFLKPISRSILLLVISTIIPVSFLFAQQTFLLTESFESGAGITLPSGWEAELVTGTQTGVTVVAGSSSPTITAAYDGEKFVQYGSGSILAGSTRLKRTIPVVTTNKAFPMVDFAWYEDPGFPANPDSVTVQWSTDGTTWFSAGSCQRYNAVAGWKRKHVLLPAGAANQPALYVAFLFTSANGNNCALDHVHVTVGPASLAFATIGTGSASSNYPYTTRYMGGRTQMLFTASELTTAGITAGNITSVGFNVISFSSQVMNGFYVKMGTTTLTTLSAGFVNGLAAYYSLPYAVPGTGWRDITLTNPFTWDGVSNVIVEICYANTGYTSHSPVYATTATGKTAGHYADNQSECSTTTNNAPLYRPNIRLGFPSMSGGMLMGYIRDAVTLAPVPGAVVYCGTMRDTSRADGFYIFYNLPAGTVNVSAMAAGYTSAAAPATISAGTTTQLDLFLTPGPTVGGIVTDASTGLQVIGATINLAGSIMTMSVAGGSYLFPQLSLSGVQTIMFEKTGYDAFVGMVNLVPGTMTTQNAALLPTAYPPGPVTAALNGTPATAVDLSWSLPVGMYQLIYEDGLQDTLTVWDSAGNLNAVKFTPLGWPAKVTGGKVNLGPAASYPSNALPLSPFTMQVYMADGPGGLPGTLAASTSVTPSGFGWASFTFSTPVTINSGDFYLAMKQGGLPPHAAGVAIDTTASQMRSFSRDVAAGGAWTPFPGNFMIRAIVQGAGGPLLSDNPALSQEPTAAFVTGPSGDQSVAPSFQVWRLLQGQENNPATWISVATTAMTTATDNTWPVLPPGPYRWAVKAVYSPPGQRFSIPVFSNVMGNSWTSTVTVCVTQSCATDPKAGTIVRMTNTTVPDTSYSLVTDTSGCVHFSNLWNGTYTLLATKFSYQTYTSTVTITGDTAIQVPLAHVAMPPRNVAVNNQTLKATWMFPSSTSYQFQESWASGSFATNQWTTSGGINWQVSTGIGNPAPSAMFNWSPADTNYNQYLTSKPIAGINAPVMRLRYDIYLSNYGTTNVNTMAVELWDGVTWSVLKSYDNSWGNIPWTSETLNVTAQTANQAFRIRFHASGTISRDINNWNIDNIGIYSSDGTYGSNPCISGYNFYLNDSLIGFTPDTAFVIPPELVVFGQTYTACVRTLYGANLSTTACVTFTSGFLYPPRNLTGAYIPETVNLAWEPPVVASGPGLTGYNVYRNWVKRNTDPITGLTFTDGSPPYGLNSYRVSAVYGSYESVTEGPLVINAVPFTRTVTNVTITSGQVNCYNAINTVVVAGNGTTFTVETGGSTTMIAGQNILYFPGTTVQNGGFMWGYISPGGPWCAMPSMPSSGVAGEEKRDLEIAAGKENHLFRIFPNPTTGNFTAAWLPESPPGDFVVEIFGMFGERILKQTVQGERKHGFTIAERPAGVYLIRMISGGNAETVKIIKY
jgi:hypothetical protein